jgi:DNA-binding transcriptional LysR family regulator
LALLAEKRGKPAGTIRITATEHAVRSLIWPRLLPWLPKYPDIHIEISSDNRFTDIVADRFDIGVRLGGDVARDMIAARIAPDMRMAVVGSPSHLAATSTPRTLQDLEAHDCIALRLPTHGGLLQWEFTQRGKTVVTRTSGRLIFNTSELMLDAAAAGHGLAWVPRDLAEKYLDDGSLVDVLENLAITYPGYHVYYATRRASPALTLVVDALRPQPT